MVDVKSQHDFRKVHSVNKVITRLVVVCGFLFFILRRIETAVSLCAHERHCMPGPLNPHDTPMGVTRIVTRHFSSNTVNPKWIKREQYALQ